MMMFTMLMGRFKMPRADTCGDRCNHHGVEAWLLATMMLMMKRGKRSRADHCDGHCSHHGTAEGVVDDEDAEDEACHGLVTVLTTAIIHSR